MFVGQRDAELSALGQSQVKKLSERLADEKIDVIYSSDLRRAMVTAETIAAKHKLEIIVCSELREVDYGKFEGLTFEQITQLYPKLAGLCLNWDLQLKFPDGESVEELEQRVSKFLKRLKNLDQEQTILIAAHGGPLRLIICSLLGIEPKHWRQMHLDLASLSIVDIYPEVAILSLLNDTSHLR
jgi:broad specificity phosphatase PhoE